jgi:AcrR family transcriptional regulator
MNSSEPARTRIARPAARRGRPRLDDLAERDHHVEAVARQIFTSQGYARASIDEIARRAGVAKRTLYAVYGGKTGLFERVVSATADPTPIPALFNDLPTAQAVLRAAAAAVLIGPDADRGADLLRMIIAEAPAQPQLASQVRASGRLRVIRSLAGVFERLFARSLLSPSTDPAAAAELFVDTVIGGAVLTRLCCFDDDPALLIARTVALFVAGYPTWAASAPDGPWAPEAIVSPSVPIKKNSTP